MLIYLVSSMSMKRDIYTGGTHTGGTHTGDPNIRKRPYKARVFRLTKKLFLYCTTLKELTMLIKYLLNNDQICNKQ